MAGQLNSFVSPEGQKQLDQVIASLETMQKQILDLNKQQINLEIKTANSGSVADVVKNTQALTKAQSDLSSEMREYRKVQEALIPTQLKIEALDTEAAKTLAAYKVQLQEANRALREEAQANNATVQARRAATQARKDEVQAAKDLRALQEAERKETVAIQKAVEAAERKQVAQAKREEAEAQRQLNAEQKQENTNQIIQGLNGVWSVIRRIAYVLPGVGIAGIFAAIGTGLLSMVTGTNKFGSAAKDTSEDVDTLTGKVKALDHASAEYLKTIDEISSNYGKQAGSLNSLKAIIEDSTLTYKQRNDAVMELQKEFPEYFKNLDREKVLNGEVKISYDAVLFSIERRARATADASKLAKLYGEMEEMNIELEKERTGNSFIYTQGQTIGLKERIRLKQEEINDTQKAIQSINEESAAASRLGYFASETARKQFEASQKRVPLDNQNAAGLKSQIAQLEDQIQFAKIGSKELSNLIEQRKKLQALLDSIERKKDPKTHDFTNDILKAQQDFTKQYYDELSKQLEIAATNQKLIADDQKLGLKERLDAFMQYEKLHLDAQETALNGEFIQTSQALDKIEKIEQKSASKRTDQEKKLLLEKSALMQKLVAIDAQAELLRVQNAGETQKGIKTIRDQEVKDAIDGLTEIKDINADAQAKALMTNQQAYMDGNINFRKYKQEEARINHEYNQELYTAELEYLQREKELLQEQGADTTQIDKQITAIKKQQYDEDFKNFDQIQQKKEALRKKELDGWRQLGQAVLEFAKTVISGNYQKQIDALQSKNDQIEKNKQLELDAIDASNKSDEEKAKLKLQLDAQVAKQEEDNTRRINEIKRKQAVADKAASIARIVEQTAIAVITGLAEGGPVLAAIYAALGAVQLATVLAQPLPQYWKGTNNAPEGLAWVGERGSELKIERDGKMSLTPATATLDYLTAGTKIIPAEQTNEILRSLAFTQLMTPQERVYTNDDVVDALSTQTKSIVQELRKQSRKQADNKLNWELFKQVKGNGIR